MARAALESNIITGLPGGEGSYDRDGIRAAIDRFSKLGNDGYRANLIAFLEEIIPVAEDAGVVMAIHPDDPPFSLFGLPRVVSTAADARALLNAVPSTSNGLTMCAGSYGARGDNDIVGIVNALLDAEQQRQGQPTEHQRIPMRPDHGLALREEQFDKRVRPGYSYAGRMKGLVELRGVIHALTAIRGQRI